MTTVLLFLPCLLLFLTVLGLKASTPFSAFHRLSAMEAQLAHANHDDYTWPGAPVMLASLIADLKAGESFAKAWQSLGIPAPAFPPEGSGSAIRKGVRLRHCQGADFQSYTVTDCNGEVSVRFLLSCLLQFAGAEETSAQLEQLACSLAAGVRLSERLGSSLVRCVQAVRDDFLRARLQEDLRRNVYAMPRATIRLLSALPALTVLLGEFLGAQPLHFLFGSTVGVVCLVLGMLFYGCGMFWVNALMHELDSGGP